MNGIGLSAQNLDVLLMKCKIISPLRSLLARYYNYLHSLSLAEARLEPRRDRVVAVGGDRAVVGDDQRGYSMIKPKHRRIFDAVAWTASSLKRDRRFADSPLEGDGFELLAPRQSSAWTSGSPFISRRYLQARTPPPDADEAVCDHCGLRCVEELSSSGSLTRSRPIMLCYTSIT